MRPFAFGGAVLRGLIAFTIFAVVAGLAGTAPAQIPDPDLSWTRTEAGAVTVFSACGANETRDLAEAVVSFQGQALRRLLPLRPGARPAHLTVFFFPSRDTYDPYAVVPAERGFFLPGQDEDFLVAYRDSDWEDPLTPLFGDIAAAYLERNVGVLPLWIREGHAEYVASFLGNRKRLEIGIPLGEHLKLLRDELSVPVASLLDVTEASDDWRDPVRRSVFRAQAWATVHWLRTGSADGPARVDDFLRRLGDGESQAEALRAVWDLDEAGLSAQVQVAVHASAANVHLIERDFDAAPRTDRPVRVDGPDVWVRLGELAAEALPRATDRRRARELAESHLDAAAKVAGQAGAVARGRARLAEQDEDPIGALRLDRQAVELDPADAVAHLRAARLLWDHWRTKGARLSAEAASADLAEMQQHLRSCLLHRPDLVEAQVLMGLSYVGAEDPTPGISVLERARPAAPQQPDLVEGLLLTNVLAGREDAAHALVTELLRGVDADASLRAQRERPLYRCLDAVGDLARFHRDAEANALAAYLESALGARQISSDLGHAIATLREDLDAGRDIERFVPPDRTTLSLPEAVTSTLDPGALDLAHARELAAAGADEEALALVDTVLDDGRAGDEESRAFALRDEIRLRLGENALRSGNVRAAWEQGRAVLDETRNPRTREAAENLVSRCEETLKEGE
ncbi:MAG: hypothetical protein R3B81_01255 [bacterium]